MIIVNQGATLMQKSDFDTYYIYKKWLEVYHRDFDFKKHYNNAEKAVKNDLETGNIKSNSYLHKALRELFIEYKNNFIKEEKEKE